VNDTTTGDSGLESLIVIARVHDIAVNLQHLEHKFQGPDGVASIADILRAAKDVGLKARLLNSDWDSLAETPLPAIAQHQNGRFFVLAKVTKEKVLVLDSARGKPQAINKQEFLQGWSGRLILIARRAGIGGSFREFDFSWFVPAILKYKSLLMEVLVASFFLQLFALLTPLFFQVVIDKVLVHQALTTLSVLAVGLLSLSFFEVLLGTLRTYLFSHTGYRIDVALGAHLFKHLLSLPLAYFENRRVGDTVARVRELESIRNFLTGSSLTLVIDSLFTVVFLVVMYFYSPLLTLIVIAALPVYVTLALVVTPILRARLQEKFSRGAENQAFLVESVSGMETIKALAVEPQSQRRWEEQLAGYVQASFKSANLGNISNNIAGFTNKVTTVCILWVGAYQVIGGNISVGQLVAFNMLAGRVSGPILRLVQLWQDFQQAGISVQRLGDILNTKPEPAANQGKAAALPAIQGAIRFDHVTFRYQPDGPAVLVDMDIDIPAGQVVGIVGSSGSGKSTLTKLVQRLYVPEQGRVLVDGIDLGLTEPSWLRRQIGVVLQESFLFNRTVRDNIALADPTLSMERVIEAAKQSGAHDFIVAMSEGYDTMVGEHGSNLSGGQKQRIAIARALITRPRILIFDEATSALDYESESLIQQNFGEIAADRTVLIIAHRLSTVAIADRVLVIENGRLIEDGSPADLRAQKGYFARLESMQQPPGSSTANQDREAET